eukprot:gene13490-14838_t
MEIFTTVLLFFIWSVLAHEANGKNTSITLTAYLHVGPHKTGSTHLQMLLLRERRGSFEKAGFCFPLPPNSTKLHKTFSSLAFDLLKDQPPTPSIMTQVKKCFANSSSIIISAEDLSRLKVSQIQTLKDELSRLIPLNMTLQFKVVILLREYMSRYYSLFVETMKMGDQRKEKGISFSRYLMYSFDELQYWSQMDTLLLAQNYAQVFGKENLILIDYDGVNAAKLDLADVFVCKILNVSCNEVESLNKQDVIKERHNQRMSTPYLQLTYLIKFYVTTRNHQICYFTYPFIHSNIKYYHNQSIHLPIIRSNLTFLHNYSKTLDYNIRQEFRSNILYGNETAIHKVIDEFFIEEIDEQSFYNDYHWMKFQHSEYERLRKTEKLCPMERSHLRKTELSH